MCTRCHQDKRVCQALTQPARPLLLPQDAHESKDSHSRRWSPRVASLSLRHPMATKQGRYWFGNAGRKTNETLRRYCQTPSSMKRRLTAEFQVNDRAACVSQASQTAGNVTADTRHLDSSPTPLQVMRMSSLEPCFVYFFSFLNSTFGKVAHAKKGRRKGEDGSAQLCTGEVMKRPRGGSMREVDGQLLSEFTEKK